MNGQPLVLLADRLIDGSGADPVAEAGVVVEDDRVSQVGPRAGLRIPAGARVLEGHDLTVLPGFGDMHVHLGMPAGIDLGRMLMTPRSFTLMHAVPNCAATLRAGVTMARDAGLTPVGVRLAVEAGMFSGPHLRLAVSILSITGGHGDDTMPCGCRLPFDAGVDIPTGVADGPHELRRKVREVVRAGADWIKLCTSGGVFSPADDPDSAQFTVEEIAAAVDEAAMSGRRCMAHAISASGIRNAVLAGVASIEHGCFIDEETAALMRERGTWLVPTLVAPLDGIRQAESRPGSIPDSMLAKARAVGKRHHESFAIALAAGVNVAMGTDAAVGPHGANLREIALMVDCGMRPMDALVAATRSCAELLGDPDRGVLRPGAIADIVAVTGDPLAHPHLFDDPRSVRAVVQGGRVVRDDLGTGGTHDGGVAAGRLRLEPAGEAAG